MLCLIGTWTTLCVQPSPDPPGGARDHLQVLAAQSMEDFMPDLSPTTLHMFRLISHMDGTLLQSNLTEALHNWPTPHTGPHGASCVQQDHSHLWKTSRLLCPTAPDGT